MNSSLILRVLTETSLRAAGVLMLAVVAVWAMRRASSELRHAVWKAGLLAVLLLPFGVLAMPRWEVPILPETSAAVSAAPAFEALTTAPTVVRGWAEPMSPSRSRVSWPAAVVGVWLAGLGLLLVRELNCRLRLARLLRRGRPVTDPHVLRALSHAAARARYEGSFDCLVASELRVPLACGVARPMVLLPERALEWTPEVLSDVLVHELTHLRRRDPLWLWLARIACALYWFHPMVWLATRRLLAEGERACDDAVMRNGERPSGYAETLLFVAGTPWREDSAPALAFLRRHGLERRIAEVLAQGRNLKPLGPWSRALLAAAAIAAGGVAAVASPVTPCASASATGTEAPTPAPEGTKPWHPGGASRTRSAAICNENQSPAHLMSVTVLESPSADGREMKLSRPRVLFENHDASRAITAVQLGLELPTTQDRMWEDVSIAAGGSGGLQLPEGKWSAVVPARDATRLVVQVTGVRFASGDAWHGEDMVSFPENPRAFKSKHGSMGAKATPAPKAAPSEARPIEISSGFGNEPWVAARFRNPADAPVEITEARTPLLPVREDERPMTYLPAVRLENHSTHNVVGLRLRYKADAESHAVSGYEVNIPARQSVVLRRRDFDMWGSPKDMTVQVLGVRFDDGSTWGTLDSRIDARDAWVYPLEPR